VVFCIGFPSFKSLKYFKSGFLVFRLCSLLY